MPPTALIGCAQELAQLDILLRRADLHLVTLIGLGDTGKTHLALQVAIDLIDAFPDRVYFVDLAPMRPWNGHASATRTPGCAWSARCGGSGTYTAT
jgi:hypothetical protein